MGNSHLLDRTFKISLILKGLDGVLEFLGGLLLFFVPPQSIQAVVKTLTQHELAYDPHDFIATRLLHSTASLTKGTVLFSAIYLLTHGLVKIVLVVAVLKKQLWAYPWMIGFLLIFIVYQLYRMSYRFTLALLILTAFDAFIVWLTTLEYQKNKKVEPSRHNSR